MEDAYAYFEFEDKTRLTGGLCIFTSATNESCSTSLEKESVIVSAFNIQQELIQQNFLDKVGDTTNKCAARVLMAVTHSNITSKQQNIVNTLYNLHETDRRQAPTTIDQ